MFYINLKNIIKMKEFHYGIYKLVYVAILFYSKQKDDFCWFLANTTKTKIKNNKEKTLLIYLFVLFLINLLNFQLIFLKMTLVRVSKYITKQKNQKQTLRFFHLKKIFYNF